MSRKLCTVIAAAVLFCLALSGCGKAAPVSADLNALYEKLISEEGMSEMISVPGEKGLVFFGIEPSDCVQEITAICADSLLADEIWLIEAKDEVIAQRIEELAKSRLVQKGEELKSYLPEQYRIVEAAKLERRGTYIILLVSPKAERLMELADSTFKAGTD